MNALPLLRVQARYNRWANQRLYRVCAELDEAERRRDRGAFFHSIHGTLNHLLLVDRLWLGRATGRPFPVRALDQELCADYGQLKDERDRTDAELIDLVDGLAAERLGAIIHYRSLLTGQPRSLPLGLLLIHLSHHQTHHRGQLTALLSQAGQDYGDIDMIYLPEIVDCVVEP